MSTQPVRNDLIHVSDAAEIAGVSSSAIYQHGQSGRLNSTLVDGFRMFYRSEVEEYARARAAAPKGMLKPSIKLSHNSPSHGMQSLGDKMSVEILREIVQETVIDLHEPVSDLQVVEAPEFTPVLAFLQGNIQRINDQLGAYSVQIAEMEAAADHLIDQQKEFQIALASLERIQKGLATQ